MKNILILALIAITLMGCAMHAGRPIPQDKVDQLVIGKTTISEVVGLFGNPISQQKNAKEGTTVFAYVHTRFGPGIWVGSSDHTSDLLTLIFNRDGVLQDINKGTTNIGPGFVTYGDK